VKQNETWYSVMLINDDDGFLPIHFSTSKENAEVEYSYYSTQGSMANRGHKKVILMESTRVAEASRAMGELVNEEQAETYNKILAK
jgi:hypothetical protein